MKGRVKMRLGILLASLALCAASPSHAAPANTLKDMFNQVSACLSKGAGGEEAWRGAEMTLRFSLRRDGSLIGKPHITYSKLPKDEAAAVVATDPEVTPTGYGLGRHGWVSVALGRRPSRARWIEVEEWVRTSYTLIAPKRLARLVSGDDNQPR